MVGKLQIAKYIAVKAAPGYVPSSKLETSNSRLRKLCSPRLPINTVDVNLPRLDRHVKRTIPSSFSV